MVPMAVTLEKELNTFREKLPALLREGKEGQYALVHGSELHSVWDTQPEALSAGYKHFGLKPFLVKIIVKHEEPVYFSRSVKNGTSKRRDRHRRASD
jgi:hypothetical protein